MGNDPFVPSLSTGDSYANGNAVHIHPTNIGKTGIILLVLSAGLSFGLSAGAIVIASRESANAEEKAMIAEREARMLQYYVLEMDAKLIAAGFKTDAESIARKLKEKGQ
jgi:hypothetical protein